MGDFAESPVAKRARHLARRMADDYVTWGQLMGLHVRTTKSYEAKLDEVKGEVLEEIKKVDYNGALGRLREILPELETIAGMTQDEEGAARARARKKADRKERWGWLAEPGRVVRGAIIAGLGAIAAVIVTKLWP